MKIKFKKIVSSAMAIATLVVIAAGMTVSAATAFSFDLGRGDSNCITMVKQNNINYATVTITSSNLSNTSTARFLIKNNSGTILAYSDILTGNGTYTLHYTTPISYGTSVKFCVSASYNGLHITGTIDV